MSKRARYNGDVDVQVAWPAGEVYSAGEAIVVPGGLLPDDAPAATRDELIANNPNWSAVNQKTDTPKGDDNSEEKG